MKNEIVELRKQVKDQNSTVEELVSDTEPIRNRREVAEMLMVWSKSLKYNKHKGVKDRLKQTG